MGTLALDWRGHGQSEKPAGDFGTADLADDAMAVIEASRAEQVVPVALSHAGWVAIRTGRIGRRRFRQPRKRAPAAGPWQPLL
ncbi:MAG: alpha/beta hydrolase [Bryobacteraceae bacterium]|nr:alpha/beta hydrolase [Bryobacteraceae bacterium]